MATPTTLPATFVAGNVLTAAQMNNLRGAFRVLQIVSTAKTDTFTTTTTTFTDITGLSATITPSSTSSTVLVIATLSITNTSGASNVMYQFVRGSTAIGLGDTAGSRIRVTGNTYLGDANSNNGASMLFIDSPATTSATTYKVQARSNVSQPLYVNRSQSDTDNNATSRAISTLTLMEISA